jgi:hypothetical protein
MAYRVTSSIVRVLLLSEYIRCSLSVSLLIWFSGCCVILSVCYYYPRFCVIFRMLLLIFECLYYFLSACLLVLMLPGCLRYSIIICIMSPHDYVVIRSISLNVYVIIGVWANLWIFMLFSACFLMVLILLFYQWCCYLKVPASSWMMCNFECVCYSAKFCVILWMFILFSACFYYGIYIVVIPELQCYSFNFVHPRGVFHSLIIFILRMLLFVLAKCFCYSLKVHVIC